MGRCADGGQVPTWELDRHSGLQRRPANGRHRRGAPHGTVLDKWEAFGWHVQEIHGHEVGDVLGALDRADEVHARPSMIVARTIKGKGVSFMENDHRWHGMPPNQEQYEAALAELQGGLARWQA